MTCDRIRENLSAYVDGELSAEEAQAVRVHLDACGACRGEYEAIRRVSEMVKRLPRTKAPEYLAADVVQRIHGDRRHDVKGRWVRIVWPVAAAACIALAFFFLLPEEAPLTARDFGAKGPEGAPSGNEVAKAPRRQPKITAAPEEAGPPVVALRKKAGGTALEPGEREHIAAALPGRKSRAQGEGVLGGAGAGPADRGGTALGRRFVLQARDPLVAAADVRRLAARMRQASDREPGVAAAKVPVPADAAKEKRFEAEATPTKAPLAGRQESGRATRGLEGGPPPAGDEAASLPKRHVVQVRVRAERWAEFLSALKKLGRLETAPVKGRGRPRELKAAAPAPMPSPEAATAERNRVAEWAPDPETIRITVEIVPQAN